MADNQGIPFSSPDEADPDKFLRQAKRAVIQAFNTERVRRINLGEGSTSDPIMVGDRVYVVWFAKTLKNWKALLSTSIPDGRYYEATYNGDTGEAYLDTYSKISNQTFTWPDENFLGLTLRNGVEGKVDLITPASDGTFTIGLRHENGSTSVFHHVSEVLVKEGDYVENHQILGRLAPNKNKE